MDSLEKRIHSRIQHKGKGWCFTPRAFHDIGSTGAVRIALHRLVKKGEVRRLARGLYDYRASVRNPSSRGEGTVEAGPQLCSWVDAQHHRRHRGREP